MNTEASVLRAAKKYLERGWVKGTFAVDADGLSTTISGEEACAWCASGAAILAERMLKAGGKVGCAVGGILDRKAIARGYGNIALFNDAQDSVEPVLALFDEAIAELEGQVES